MLGLIGTLTRRAALLGVAFSSSPLRKNTAEAQTVGCNLKRNDPKQLGTEFIHYKRDPKQCAQEQNYTKTTFNAGAKKAKVTSYALQSFPLELNASAITTLDRTRIVAAENNTSNGRLAKLRFLTHPFKGQNLAHEMIEKGRYVVPWRAAKKNKAKAKVPAEEVAIVVAGNSGLPGGATAKILPGKGTQMFRMNLRGIHNGHTTQEESVVSNVFVHTATAKVRGKTQLINSGKKGKKPTAAEQAAIGLYTSSLQGKWGLKSAFAGDFDTVQGADYVNTKNPADFSDSWVMRNPVIGPEPKGAARGDMASAYPLASAGKGHRIGALLFVAAPNAYVSQAPTGSTTRTLNKYAKTNFNFFLAGLQAAVTGALNAAIMEQLVHHKPLKTLIFNKLGGGIYWPHHFNRFAKKWVRSHGGATRHKYEQIFARALNEKVVIKKPYGPLSPDAVVPKAAFFNDIVMTHDGMP